MRYFTIISSNIQYNGGRYMAETPKNAAKKSAKFLFTKTSIVKIYFCIKETTKNSKHKEYYYTAIHKGDKIQVLSQKKKTGGNHFFTNKKFYLQWKNDYLLLDNTGVKPTPHISNATLWEADNETIINGKTVYNIYGGEDDKLGFIKDRNTGEYTPKMGYNIYYYYDRGYFYPLVQNVLNHTIVELAYDKLLVQFV